MYGITDDRELLLAGLWQGKRAGLVALGLVTSGAFVPVDSVAVQ